jgi:hypothetical protein
MAYDPGRAIQAEVYEARDYTTFAYERAGGKSMTTPVNRPAKPQPVWPHVPLDQLKGWNQDESAELPLNVWDPVCHTRRHTAVPPGCRHFYKFTCPNCIDRKNDAGELYKAPSLRPNFVASERKRNLCINGGTM